MCEATGKLIDQLSKLHVLTLWKEPTRHIQNLPNQNWKYYLTCVVVLIRLSYNTYGSNFT